MKIAAGVNLAIQAEQFGLVVQGPEEAYRETLAGVKALAYLTYDRAI